MKVKINIPVGFKILNHAIDFSEFAKKNFADEVAGDVMHVVMCKAEENGSDPNSDIQYVSAELIPLSQEKIQGSAELTPELKRAIVILATYPLVADSFARAARDVYGQKADILIKYYSSADTGLNAAFEEFKAAKAIFDFARENINILPQLNDEMMRTTDLRAIGKNVAMSLDKHLPK